MGARTHRHCLTISQSYPHKALSSRFLRLASFERNPYVRLGLQYPFCRCHHDIIHSRSVSAWSDFLGLQKAILSQEIRLEVAVFPMLEKTRVHLWVTPLIGPVEQMRPKQLESCYSIFKEMCRGVRPMSPGDRGLAEPCLRQP